MRYIYAISDATGKTAEGVIRAAITQFDDSALEIVRQGSVLTAQQVHQVVSDAAKNNGFIVHTIVSEKMRRVMYNAAREANVAAIDLMGPMLARLSEYLSARPRAEPGLFKGFDSSYIQRIEAIDFTVRHDDGQKISDLGLAEIVLVGVSRTSKTPLSIYLGYRGWKVANVPLVLGIDPPKILFELPRRRVVGLIIRPERLMELRQARVDYLGTGAHGYADLEYIRQEMDFAYRVYDQRRDWPLVDVTSKPIEETAAEVISLLGHSSGHLDEI
ncbi:MAG: kinase/pyrophosphorylase [Chloroflexi bacterium]|nr:kinase/pyrophosphorylase [Chloroflexota bacterium]